MYPDASNITAHATVMKPTRDENKTESTHLLLENDFNADAGAARDDALDGAAAAPDDRCGTTHT